MTSASSRIAPWILFVNDEKGKERKAGRFATDSLAFRFIEDYGISGWRLEGPDNQLASSPLTPE